MKFQLLVTTALMLQACGDWFMTFSTDPSISSEAKERVSQCSDKVERQICESGACFASIDGTRMENAYHMPGRCEYVEFEKYGPMLSCVSGETKIEHCSKNEVCKEWYTQVGSFVMPICEER